MANRTLSRCSNQRQHDQISGRQIIIMDQREDICRRLNNLSAHLSTEWASEPAVNELEGVLRHAEDLIYHDRVSSHDREARPEGHAREAATQTDHRSLSDIDDTASRQGDATSGSKYRSKGQNLSKIAEESRAKFQWLTNEMEKRATESRQICERVSAWRSSVAHEMLELQAMSTSNQEQNLAELRYLRHKIERLEMRLNVFATFPQCEVGDLESHEDHPHAQSREPNIADSGDALGTSARLASIPFPNRFMDWESRVPRTDGSATMPQGRISSVELERIPISIYRQIDRAQRESEEIEASMRARGEDIAEHVLSMNASRDR